MILILAAVALNGADAPIRWNLALNDRWSYRLVQTFQSAGSSRIEDEQRFEYKGSFRVTGIKPGEFDFETIRELIGQRMGSDNLPIVKDKPEPVRQVFFRQGGQNWEPDRYASEDEFRLNRLLWFGFPLRTGAESWRCDWPAMRPDWGPAAVADYRLTGKTERLGRPCWLFSVRYSEINRRPTLKAAGTAEVDQDSGILMGAQLQAQNALVPGGEELQDLTLKFEVTELLLQKRSG